jgi:RHS repeat-associated protein
LIGDNENFGYGYDPAGNLNLRTNNTLIQAFTTDGANQLLNVDRSGLLTFAGNLTNTPMALSINGQTATVYHDLTFAVTNGLVLNNGLNEFTAVISSGLTMTNVFPQVLPATVTLAYDTNGNLVSDGLHGYAYDCANELVQVTVTNFWQTQYTYDGFGRRRTRQDKLWETNQWVSTNLVEYVYDGMTVIQERNSNNVPVVTYTRGTDLSGTPQGAGGIGGLLARTDSGGSSYYHTDGNGNVTMLVNGAGGMVAKYLYDSYGNTLGMWGTLTSANTYRYASKEIDLKSGQYYYGYRYYQPNLQRWLNRDPIAEAGGIDLYKFVGNSPINWIDPFGLEGGPGEGEEGGGGYGDDGEGYGGGFGKYGGYPSESPGGVPYNNGSVEDQVAAFIYMRLAEGDTLVLIPKSK